MKSRRLFAGLCALFVALGSIQYAQAQATVSYALLNGTVMDEGGRPIAKATITVRSLDTNQTFSAVSDQSGFYAVPSLPPGRYELTVVTQASENIPARVWNCPWVKPRPST